MKTAIVKVRAERDCKGRDPFYFLISMQIESLFNFPIMKKVCSGGAKDEGEKDVVSGLCKVQGTL